MTSLHLKHSLTEIDAKTWDALTGERLYISYGWLKTIEETAIDKFTPSLNCLAALSRPVNVECVGSYEAGIKGVWLYSYLKSLLEELRSDGGFSEIIQREIISIRGTRFDIGDNLVDFSPVLGLILRLFKKRKGDV